MVKVLVKDLNSLTSIRIGGKSIAYEKFKESFLSLNYKQIDYVLKHLRQNKADIRNIHAYLLTLLYNADENIKNREVTRGGDKNKEIFDYSRDEDIWQEFLDGE